MNAPHTTHAVDVVAQRTRATVAPHVLPLNDDRWTVWRCAALRAAGFPVDDVLQLAAPDAASLADALAHAEDELQRAREVALDVLLRAADATSGQARTVLHKARKAIATGTTAVSAADIDPTAREAIDAHAAAYAQHATLRERYAAAYAAAETRALETLCAIADTPRFREALIWQNRVVYRFGLQALLHKPAGHKPWKQRHHRDAIAMYVQRYHVKNDTIGFFGPTGWIALTDDTIGMSARPGRTLLEARHVYFETWSIDALCDALDQDDALRPWMPPRIVADVRVDGRTASMQRGDEARRIELSDAQVTVLQACDAQRSAADIADDLVQSHPESFVTEADVYAELAALVRLGVIAWRVEVAYRLHPEIELRRLLERVGDERARRESLQRLDDLERARADVAAAAGDPEQLDESLDRMDRAFTSATGRDPTRNAGQTYAGRTVLFEDCRRDLDVEIGRDVVEELARPMSLLLRSARWFTAEMAVSYRDVFARIYRELAHASGSPIVEGQSFWTAAQPLLAGKDNPLFQEILGRFRERWVQVLMWPERQRRAARSGDTHAWRFTSDELRDRVEAAFPSRNPGWDWGRYCSPDLMIAASSVDEIRCGNYFFVIGELHVGKNTLDSQTFLNQHRTPSEPVRWIAADLRRPRVRMLRKRIRGMLRSDMGTDYFVEREGTGPVFSRPRRLRLADLVLEMHDDVLVMRTRDGRVRFEIIEFCAEPLSDLSVDVFKRILAQLKHAPRVTIDRLVLYRERWCFSASDLAWAAEESEAVRFVGARRWAREHELPRFVFVKSTAERKPFYVDFESLTYVSLLGKAIRRTVKERPDLPLVVVTEMLPTHEQVWVPDAEGRRYTGELRIVMFDQFGRDDGGSAPVADSR